MRIQHNIMAMNAYRNYNNNTSSLSKNLEKLSSGYKINRAGDDAAGLAISEKMRAQITGLDVAQKNAKDGISLVQTAEGALTEVHDMLNRMYELANQSANGTYEDTTDRNQLQKEVVQLRSEIDRIADAANFNGIKLLDGTMDAEGVTGGGATAVKFGTVSAEKEKISMALPSFTVNLEGLAVKAGSASADVSAKIKVGSKTFTVSGAASKSGAIAEFNAFTKVGGAASVATATIGGLKYTVGIASGVLTFTAKTSQTNADLTKPGVVLNPSFEVTAQAGTKGSIVGSLVNGGTQIIQSGRVEQNETPAQASFALTLDMLKEGAKIKIGDQTFTIDYKKKGSTATGTVIGVKDLLDKKTGQLEQDDIKEIASRITKAEGGNNKVFVVGHNGTNITLTGKGAAPTTVDLTDVEKIKGQVSVTVPEIHGTALTLQIGDSNDSYNQLQVSIKNCHAASLGIGTIDIGKQADAKAAAGSIKKAIDYISDVRGTLGATQNRLDHTINNLSVMQENIQDAEATIRDTDVADEMMAYTKNNILIQSAQAMLAQANQVPQGVLQLLQ